MPEPVRIGIVDSGCRVDQLPKVLASAGFTLSEGQIQRVDAQEDRIGHGSEMLDIVAWVAPEARFLVAQVFRERLSTSAVQVSVAIDWLVGQGAQVINLSLGLRHDREMLSLACQRALAAGVILCASAPARGAAVYPGAYAGVFRMTGDARCKRGEISYLETVHADFGAHVRPLGAGGAGTGASAGCAHLTGAVARYLGSGGVPALSRVRRYLIERARYRGPERRVG